MIRRRILYGGDEVDYSKQYLTIVSLADNNTIYWKCSSNTSSFRRYILISTDEGRSWTAKQSSSYGETLAKLDNGKRMLIRRYINSTYGGSSFDNYFISTQDFKVEGNVMSMTTSSDFESASSLGSYALKGLFYNCVGLRDAENLVLPATSLGTYCYYCMFSGCTRMTKGPKELPINPSGLATYCYSGMFYNCTSLSETPTTRKISQETVSDMDYVFQNMFYNCSSIVTAENFDIRGIEGSYSHDHMFYNCSNLVTSPYFSWSPNPYGCLYMFANCTSLKNMKSISYLLYSGNAYFWAYMFRNCSSLESVRFPNLTLVSSSGMIKMFEGCSSLSEIKVENFSKVSGQNTIYISSWVKDVSATGTFYKKAGINWSSGTDGIPSGWTVVEV